MRGRALTLIALPLPAACAVPSTSAIEASLRDLDCGIGGAISGRLGRMGRGDYSTVYPVRACALPEPRALAIACAGPEGVPNGRMTAEGRHDMDFPDYRVRGERCRFTDAGRMRAFCTFELAGASEPPRWRPVRVDLTYRFRDVSNEIEHASFMTSWEIDGDCRER